MSTLEVTKIVGDFFSVDILSQSVHLVIAAPPYGGIVNTSWDKLTEDQTVDLYMRLMRKLETI